LILLPTRELATQIDSILSQLLESINSSIHDEPIKIENHIVKGKSKEGDYREWITSQLFIGGTSVRQDIETFSKTGAHILIGTPGRVQDLLSAHPSLFHVKELEVLVMDEADRLLDLGFEKQLMAIISSIPKQRRTCLFSATMSEGLSRIVKAGLRNPVKIVVKVQKTSSDPKSK
jgi:superfamily II DNA/RNA helicase